jgi:Tfp pilus assembly protein PilV
VGSTEADDGSGLSWIRVLVAVLVLAGAAIVLIGAGAALNVARAARRRRAASGASDRVDLAWQEAVESLVRAGAAPTRGASPERVAHEATGTAGSAANDLRDLARLTTAVAYGTAEPGSDVAERATVASGTVTATLLRAQPPARRLLWVIDPRPPRGP